jgi:hypothetical protein
LLGRMRIHGARSKTAFRKVLSERPRESPGKPGLGSVGRSRLLREGDCLAQQGAGFRIGAACLESLVEITGRCDRERLEESIEKGIGWHDGLLRRVEGHGQSPRTRTIGRLMIQPEMQQAIRTRIMRCLQERKRGHPPLTRGRCPRSGMRFQAMTSNEASPFFAGSGSIRHRR